MKKRILIVPSWFSKEGLIGSFFREQAEVLHSSFDIRFLVGGQEVLGLKTTLKALKKIKEYRKLDFVNGVCPIFYFKYPSFWFLPEKINFKIKVNLYNYWFNKVVNNHKWKPDLIHAQSTMDAGLLAYYINKKFNVPYIITEHNLFLLIHISNYKLKLTEKTLTQAKSILTVSHDKSRQILMHNINIKPLVVGNLVNDDLFYYKERALEDCFVITIIAHFHWIKDYDTFFETMFLINQNASKPLKVNCVGFASWKTDDDTNELLKLCEKYDIKDIVKFYPNVERSQINKFYWNTDAFVLTSIAEGLPVSALEALACGRPVFATRCGGVEDIITDENGRLVPIKDAISLSEHIISFINGKIEFDNRKISEDIISKYGRKAFSKRIEGIYNYLILDN